MVFRIGDVKIVAAQRKTLRTIESRGIESAVFGADFARADRLDECAVEFSDDDAVVIRVGDEQTIATCIRENLARKSERQLADFRALEHEFQRFFIQLAFGAKVSNRLADGCVDDVIVTFAGNTADDVTRRMDDRLGGPRRFSSIRRVTSSAVFPAKVTMT